MEHIVISGDLAISCYGLLEENSNFEVVCDDEEDDSIWCEGNTETGEPFTVISFQPSGIYTASTPPSVEIPSIIFSFSATAYEFLPIGQQKSQSNITSL